MAPPGPDFIVIGAQKSGTTSLYRYLVQHPQVAPAATKQLDFFAVHFERGLDWYRAQFPERGGGVLCGEASPYYMLHPHTPRRVHEFDPALKLIAILRNPVDRTYSHYQHQVRNHREPLSFEEALDREEERLAGEAAKLAADPGYYSRVHRRHSYLARSRYAGQLERWLALFPREQLLVLPSEPMFEQPERTLATVTSFLGLPPLHLERYGVYMPGSYVKEMRPETRRRLVEHFRPHNERLFELVGERYAWWSELRH